MKRKNIYIVSIILIVATILILFIQSFITLNRNESKKEVLKKQMASWGYDLLFEGIAPYQNQRIKIAIIDSGINKQHEDLQNIKFKEFNVLDKGAPITDEFGHGTAIAGIIAAEDNELGVVGISQHVDIYDVKILDKNGKGEVEHLIQGIEWSIEQNVDIINLSFGFQTENKLLKEAIDSALIEDIIIVAAIGNTYGMRGDYPAIYEGGYSIFEGTSFAAAHATGVISILLNSH